MAPEVIAFVRDSRIAGRSGISGKASGVHVTSAEFLNTSVDVGVPVRYTETGGDVGRVWRAAGAPR